MSMGVWKHDAISGPGMLEFKDNNVDFFMGEMKDNEPVKGFMQLKSGAKYYGEF